MLASMLAGARRKVIEIHRVEIFELLRYATRLAYHHRGFARFETTRCRFTCLSRRVKYG